MSNGNHPHGDPNAQGDGYGYGDEAQQSYPQEGWGGEYDADATAFVQLPTGPLPPPGAGVEAWGPLAAPGTGQGGYTPPSLNPADVSRQPSSGPATPAPTTDPATTGQWGTPFGQGYPGQGPAGGGQAQQDGPSYGQQYADQYADQYAQQHADQYADRYGQQPGRGAQRPTQQGHQQAHQYDFPSAPSGEPGSSATGQGAAAALAGSHEARTQRRPLGAGGASYPGDPDEAEPIGPGTPFGAGRAEQRHDPMAEAQLADAHARRQVHFDGNGDGSGQAAPAARESGARAYALPHESDDNDDIDGSGSTRGSDAEQRTDGNDDGGHERLGTVRSGLPWTPSTASEHPSGQWTVGQTDQGAPATGNGWSEAPQVSAAAPEAPVAEPSPEPPAEAAADAGLPSRGGAPHRGAALGGTSPEDGADGELEPGTATDEAVLEERPVELAPELGGEHPHVSYVLHVNGVDRPVTDAWIGESLLYVLRERLGLAGAKDGCSQGECGACSVQVDGRLVASCLVPAATSAGSEIRTVEGLATDGEPSDVQRALTGSGAVQCGFCVPGLAMTVHDLLEGNHAPSELETRKAICGNLCRCSGYRGVLDAVRTVVNERAELAAREEAEAEAEAYGDPAAGPPRIPHQAGPGAGGAYFPEGGGA